MGPGTQDFVIQLYTLGTAHLQRAIIHIVNDFKYKLNPWSPGDAQSSTYTVAQNGPGTGQYLILVEYVYMYVCMCVCACMRVCTVLSLPFYEAFLHPFGQWQ